MSDSTFNLLRAKALGLSRAERAALARELVASLDAPQSSATESDYRRRMRNYTEKAWLLAAKTLTVQNRFSG